jgi:3-methyladenine DNA glycosylase AlkD
MNHNDVLLKLQQLAKGNGEYREFNVRTINDVSVEYIGVRIPDLRRLAREIAAGDWRRFLRQNNWQIHELKMLAFLLPQYLRLDFDELFEIYDLLIPLASSWANTDTLVVKNKVVMENPTKASTKIKQYLASRNGWTVRVGLNILRANFLDNEHIKMVLAEVKKLDDRYRAKSSSGSLDYYVKMAMAWLLATAAVNHRAEVEKLLDKIDRQTAKMTHQKMRDSRRIR